VGLDGLGRALSAVKRQLGERILAEPSINLPPGGWGDIRRRVDTRVLVTLLYMSHRHRGITVSSLIRGHGYFTKLSTSRAD
jgi:hypothetical protein